MKKSPEKSSWNLWSIQNKDQIRFNPRLAKSQQEKEKELRDIKLKFDILIIKQVKLIFCRNKKGNSVFIFKKRKSVATMLSKESLMP